MKLNFDINNLDSVIKFIDTIEDLKNMVNNLRDPQIDYDGTKDVEYTINNLRLQIQNNETISHDQLNLLVHKADILVKQANKEKENEGYS